MEEWQQSETRDRPPGGLAIIAATALAGLAIYATTFPTGLSPSSALPCAAWLAAIALAIGYIVRLLKCVTTGALTWSPRWLALPVLASLVIWAASTDTLLRLRFERSRPAFEAEAARLLSAPPTGTATTDAIDRGEGWLEFAPYGKYVGSFYVEMICTFPDEGLVYFYTGGYFRGGTGILYDRDDRRPPLRGDFSYRPLVGPWNVFRFSLP